MAVLMGKSGYIYTADTAGASATSAIANIDSWSINPTADVIETTAFGSAGTTVKTFAYGLKGATGNCSGNMEGATHQTYLLDILANTTVTTVEMKLYASASKYYSCEALVSGETITATVGDKITFSFDFTVTGALTYTD